jgi:hypothetical protein
LKSSGIFFRHLNDDYRHHLSDDYRHHLSDDYRHHLSDDYRHHLSDDYRQNFFLTLFFALFSCSFYDGTKVFCAKVLHSMCLQILLPLHDDGDGSVHLRLTPGTVGYYRQNT